MLFRVQELSNAVSSARLGYLTMLFQVPGIEPRSSSS